VETSGGSPFLSRPDERQVFLDPTGRRVQRVRAGLTLGIAAGVLWLAGLGVGSVGFVALPGTMGTARRGVSAHVATSRLQARNVLAPDPRDRDRFAVVTLRRAAAARRRE
jgi:hypothetical protein